MGSVEAGIGLALLGAVMANLASLLKHRGCQQVPHVKIRAPLRSARCSSTTAFLFSTR